MFGPYFGIQCTVSFLVLQKRELVALLKLDF